jgi:ectoine hydroxylase-related dioxygenase (phytanoyl-CoA dioxygenase family)
MERLTDGRAPAIWLGLTDATIENGCLRVVPRSHRTGMLAHDSRRDQGNLAYSSTNLQEPMPFAEEDIELSVKLARAPEGLAPPHDVVMLPGEMSFHHPLLLHGSNPNRSQEPRIGLSATYSIPELHNHSASVALVRGNTGPHHPLELSQKPACLAIEDAAATYRVSGRQILYLSD